MASVATSSIEPTAGSSSPGAISADGPQLPYQYQPGSWAGSLPDPLPRKSSATLESDRKQSTGIASVVSSTLNNAMKVMGNLSHRLMVWHEVENVHEEFSMRFKLAEGEVPVRRPWKCKILSGQDQICGKLFLTSNYVTFREGKKERPNRRVQFVLPLSSVVSIQRGRGDIGSFTLARDFAETPDAILLYDKDGLVHTFTAFVPHADVEDFYNMIDIRWRPLIETTPASLLERCRDIPDSQNIPERASSSIFEPPPSDPRIRSVFAQPADSFKPPLLSMTRTPVRAANVIPPVAIAKSESSDFIQKREIAAAELYQIRSHQPRLSMELRQSIESFDRDSSLHHIVPGLSREAEKEIEEMPLRTKSLTITPQQQQEVLAPTPVRARAESLPASVLRDIRYYGLYRTLNHVTPMIERRTSSPKPYVPDTPEYRKYSAPAELRREVVKFSSDRSLHHIEPPASKPLAHVLAFNEYEPQPQLLLESIRAFDAKTKLKHIKFGRERSPKYFYRWRLLLRQVELFHRVGLRHVEPTLPPCYPLYLDATDSDEWWQRTFFAGRQRLTRFVLHDKSKSESKFAVLLDRDSEGTEQTVKLPKLSIEVEKEVRIPTHIESLSAVIAGETQNAAAGLA